MHLILIYFGVLTYSSIYIESFDLDVICSTVYCSIACAMDSLGLDCHGTHVWKCHTPLSSRRALWKTTTQHSAVFVRFWSNDAMTMRDLQSCNL